MRKYLDSLYLLGCWLAACCLCLICLLVVSQVTLNLIDRLSMLLTGSAIGLVDGLGDMLGIVGHAAQINAIGSEFDRF